MLKAKFQQQRRSPNCPRAKERRVMKPELVLPGKELLDKCLMASVTSCITFLKQHVIGLSAIEYNVVSLRGNGMPSVALLYRLHLTADKRPDVVLGLLFANVFLRARASEEDCHAIQKDIADRIGSNFRSHYTQVMHILNAID